MTIGFHTNDEQPAWEATVTTINGIQPDYSSGYTFTCTITTLAGATLLAKTTGITGAAAGVITVAFTGAELATALVTATAAGDVLYKLFLVPRRTSDSTDGPTIEDRLLMKWRP